MDWKDHPNAKEFSRGERISMGLANFGKERVSRKNMDNNAYEEEWTSRKSARGGSTAKPERLSRSERRAADKILKEGKQPRGKK